MGKWLICLERRSAALRGRVTGSLGGPRSGVMNVHDDDEGEVVYAWENGMFCCVSNHIMLYVIVYYIICC